ncbi:MAG: RHS repeat domain-containing protein [Microthrixaceae bacterium]
MLSTPPRSVSFNYDFNGDLVEWTDVGGATWAFTYDTSHRLLTMRDPKQAGKSAPGLIANVYDPSGRVVSQSDRLGYTTAFDYDTVKDGVIVTNPQGRLVLKRYADGLVVSETQGYGSADASTTRVVRDGHQASHRWISRQCGQLVFDVL